MVAPSHRGGISLADLFTGYSQDQIPDHARVTGITSNSNEVSEGGVFFALAGIRSHAMDYVSQAVAAGAAAVAYDTEDEYSLQQLQLLCRMHAVIFVGVRGLARQLGEIASRFYAYPSRQFRLIGITGTDGKTSVTHLIVQALARLGRKAGSVGTLGYGVNNHLDQTRHTTPDAINLQSMLFELAVNGCEYVVMEVSSHALHQFRVSGCEFDVAVLTNLGSDHLDYHGDVKAYGEAKQRLFDYPGLSARVLNRDDAFGRELELRFNGDKVMSWSSRPREDSNAKVRLLSAGMQKQGLHVEFATASANIRLQTGLAGRFNIDNLLTCAAVLLSLGFSAEQVEQGMQGLRPIPGRMEYLAASDGQAAVVIDYAHTEQALRACLESLADSRPGRLICVFGCGGDRDAEKRPKMAAVAEQLSNLVIVTDDNPRHESPQQIMRDILNGFNHPEQVRVIHDRATAIRAALAEAAPEDLVVIAGKGHEQEQIVGDQRYPFSDHKLVQSIREGRLS